MRGGLSRQHSGLRPRPFDAQDGHESRLAGGFVLARRLAQLLRAAFDVEQVVDDLKRQAEIVRIGPRAPFAWGRSPCRGWRPPCTRRRSNAPVFRRCRWGDGADRLVGISLLGQQVEHLPAQPCRARPAAFASSLTSAVRTAGSPCVSSCARTSKASACSASPARSLSLHQIACGRWVCRAADRRRPSPADRRGSENKRARTRWRTPFAGRAASPPWKQRRTGQHEKGAQTASPPPRLE